MILALRRIPDGTCVGPVLDLHFRTLGHFHVKELCVICRPSWGRDLDDANVVERTLFRIEIRIGPMRGQERITNSVGVAGIRDIDGIADRRIAATITADISVI